MAARWDEFFDNFGIKLVTKTDKAKEAYVLNAQQRKAARAAGIKPAHGKTFSLPILFDSAVGSVEVSFYDAERSVEAARLPEARMGREFITTWLKAGDEVVIGNVGDQLFAAKTRTTPADQESAKQELVKRLDRRTIISRALRARGKPKKKIVSRNDFIRNPYVAWAAVLRSEGRCEMPECNHRLFEREDGTMYLETHHIVPLAEGGDDTLANAAALCPHCHRLLHYGKDRLSARKSLADCIASLPDC